MAGCQLDKFKVNTYLSVVQRVVGLLQQSPLKSIVVLAILYSFSFPPWNLLPAIVAVAVYIKIIFEFKSAKKAFLLSLAFNFVAHAISSYYIVVAFKYGNVGLAQAYFLGLLSLFLVASVTAIVMATMTMIGLYISRTYFPPNGYLIVIPAFIALGEFIRAESFLALPLNLTAYTVAQISPLVQLISFSNIYVLSFLVMVIALLSLCSRLIWFFIIGLVSLWCIDFQLETKPIGSSGEQLRVRLVNPDIDQATLEDDSYADEILRKLVRLSQSAGSEDIDLFIWPEASIRFYLDGHSKAMENRRRAAGFLFGDQQLISGTSRFERKPEGKADIFTTMVLLDSSLNILDFHDKQKLVPFGEYIPLRSALPTWLTKVFGSYNIKVGSDDFRMTLNSGLNILPLLCAEGHFPGLVRKNIREDDQLIVMIGNEGWVRDTTEPSHYLTSAMFRAAASNVPVILASNQGYLAVIDKNGQVLSFKAPEGEQILDFSLSL